MVRNPVAVAAQLAQLQGTNVFNNGCACGAPKLNNEDGDVWSNCVNNNRAKHGDKAEAICNELRNSFEGADDQVIQNAIDEAFGKMSNTGLAKEEETGNTVDMKISNSGDSEGARKGWETRRAGGAVTHLTDDQLDAVKHYDSVGGRHLSPKEERDLDAAIHGASYKGGVLSSFQTVPDPLQFIKDTDAAGSFKPGVFFAASDKPGWSWPGNVVMQVIAYKGSKALDISGVSGVAKSEKTVVFPKNAVFHVVDHDFDPATGIAHMKVRYGTSEHTQHKYGDAGEPLAKPDAVAQFRHDYGDPAKHSNASGYASIVEQARLNNGGTSEGAKKGWIARHGNAPLGYQPPTSKNHADMSYSHAQFKAAEDYLTRHPFKGSAGQRNGPMTEDPANQKGALAEFTGEKKHHQDAQAAHEDAAAEWHNNGEDDIAEWHKGRANDHYEAAQRIKNSGTSEGVTKSWETRRASHLPIGPVNLSTHHNAMFGKVWHGWEEGKGSNILVRQGDKRRAIHTSGDLESTKSYYPEGSNLDLTHDQTMKQDGRWQVEKHFPHDSAGMAALKAHTGKTGLPFSTFK